MSTTPSPDARIKHQQSQEPLGLRERTKVRRRQRIEDAAMDLFEQNGFEETTIADIAETADISSRTFYAYFESKDDVVLADYAQRLTRIITEFDARPPSESSWTALQSAFAMVSRDYEEQADWLLRRLRIMATTPSVFVRSLQLQAGWEQALSLHIAERTGASTNDPGPRLLAATALAAMRSSIQHWLISPRATALPELVQQAFDRLGSGLEDT